MDFKKHFKVAMGYYMEANDNPTVTNNMNSLTYEYIELGTTRNPQGAFKVLCIYMKRVLNRIQIIPMVVIEQTTKQ